jgi:hypothetical protein
VLGGQAYYLNSPSLTYFSGINSQGIFWTYNEEDLDGGGSGARIGTENYWAMNSYATSIMSLSVRCVKDY